MTTTQPTTTKKYHTWDEVRGELSPEEEAELVDLRAEAASEAVAYSLGELRQARAMTQIELADRLKRAQPTISEMENTNDHLISTVRSVVESLGGRLEIAAVFDDERIPIVAPPRPQTAPTLAFWQWVATRRDGGNPRGDFIRDTRGLLAAGVDPPTRMMTCADDEALTEYRRLRAQYLRESR